MTVVESYALAVAMCVVTMLCWGSWANTQKLATQGVAVPALLLGLRDRRSACLRSFWPSRWAARARPDGRFLADLRRRRRSARLRLHRRRHLQPVQYSAGGGDRHRRDGRGLPDRCRAGAGARRHHQLPGDAAGQSRASLPRRRLRRHRHRAISDRLQPTAAQGRRTSAKASWSRSRRGC